LRENMRGRVLAFSNVQIFTFAFECRRGIRRWKFWILGIILFWIFLVLNYNFGDQMQ